MILVDDRSHEPPLIPYFQPYGVEVESVVMDAADIVFAGNGPNESTVSVGAERKRVGDLVSSIRSERFAGFQLDGLLEFDYPILLIEGIYRPQRDTGLLEVLRNGGFKTQRVGSMPILYREVASFLFSMQFICGIRVIRTNGPEETAECIVALYRWFEKPWEKHKAHKAIYAPVPERNGNRAGMIRRKPSLAVKIAAQIEGIDSKAWEVGDYFKTVEHMMNANVEEWMKALKIKKGRTKAESIVRSLHQ